MMGLTTDHITLFDHFMHKIETSSTLRSRILAEKLACPQLVKKFPAVYETRRFITVNTSAHHLSLPSATSIQCMFSITLLPEDPFKYYPAI